MRTSKTFQWLIVVVGVAAMLASSGCAGKRDKQGPRTTGIEEFGPGGYSEGGFGELGMMGDSFASLPKVEGAAFGPVYFAYDNYQLPSSEYGTIDIVADFMRANPSVVLVVEGHCDERGTNEYNMSLGEYRAQSVRSYLVNAGISPERIQTVSYGEEKPAAFGTGESVWRLNRRGEFVLYQR